MSIQLFDAYLNSKRKRENSGLTLIECLVAIFVISVSAAVITPVMLVSVATRVQSQKAEQAFQLAQLEIDSIRIEVERGGDYSSFLNLYPDIDTSSATTLEEISTLLVSEPAPDNSAPYLDPSDTQVARQVDTDNDGDVDFAVQVFRTDGVSPTGSTIPIAFKVGVRVYDSRSFEKNKDKMLREPASLSFTSGEGRRSLRPLAVIYADVFQSDQTASLCEYHKYTYEGPDDATAGLECD